MLRSFEKNWWSSVAIIAVFLLLVELVVRAGLLPLFIPAPSAVALALANMLVEGNALFHAAVTLRRLLIGIAIGATPGLILGLLMGGSETINRMLSPIFAAVHPIPRIALLPLYIVIFGLGDDSNVMVIATAAFFPVLFNAIAGVKQIDRTYFEVAHNYGLSSLQTFYYVLLRGSAPSVLAGLRLSLNRGMVLAVAVELLTSADGLGSLVDLAWRTLRIDDLYASLVLIGLIGIGLEFFVTILEKRFAAWHAGE